MNIYILVKDRNTGDLIQLIFDNGDYFDAENDQMFEQNKTPEQPKKMPENFEDYLKSLKGKGQKIEKRE